MSSSSTHFRPCPMWGWVVGLGYGAGYVELELDCSGGLWEVAEPLIPPSKVRPQGGGTQDTPDETLFEAIIYVLVSGCAWRAFATVFRRIEVDRASPVPDLVPGGSMGAAARGDPAPPGRCRSARPLPSSPRFRPREGERKGRTRRSESRGPRQAGFQDARLVGRERTAPPRRRLGRQHP
jgi:hypothetical protein